MLRLALAALLGFGLGAKVKPGRYRAAVETGYRGGFHDSEARN